MALSYAEMKSGGGSTRSSGKSGGGLSYQELKKQAAPRIPQVRAALAERDFKHNKQQNLQTNLRRANEEATRYADAATKANKKVSVLEMPGKFLQEVGRSIARPGVSLYQGITKPFHDAKGTYNLPGIGQVESYQNEVERRVGEVKASGGSLGDVARVTGGVALQPAIDVASTVYAPAKGFQVLRGGKFVRDTVGMGLKVGAPIGGTQALADSLKEKKSVKETVKDVAKGAAVGTAVVAGLGAAGKAVMKTAQGISSFFKKKSVPDTIIDRRKEITENPDELISKAGKPKDPVDFLATRSDLEVQRVPAIPREDGSVVGTSFHWDSTNKKGKLLISPAATPESIAQEIGNYIEKKTGDKATSKEVQSEINRIFDEKFNADDLSKAAVNSLLNNPENRLNKPNRLAGEKYSYQEAKTGLTQTGKDMDGRIVFGVNDEGKLVLEDGTHLLEAYRDLGKEIPARKVTFSSDAAKKLVMGDFADKGMADAIKVILTDPQKAKNAPGLVSYLEDAGIDVPGVVGTSSKQIKAESALLKRANEVMPDEFKMDTSREKITIKDELKRAAELYQSNPVKALAVALGKAKADGEFQNAMYVYLKEVATKNKDWDTLAKLAKAAQLRSTRFGQENAILAADVASPQAKYLKKLFEMKLQLGQVPGDLKSSLEQAIKAKKGREASHEEVTREAISEGTKELKSAVKKKKVDLKRAQELIDKLTCK